MPCLNRAHAAHVNSAQLGCGIFVNTSRLRLIRWDYVLPEEKPKFLLARLIYSEARHNMYAKARMHERVIQGDRGNGYEFTHNLGHHASNFTQCKWSKPPECPCNYANSEALPHSPWIDSPMHALLAQLLQFFCDMYKTKFVAVVLFVVSIDSWIEEC